MSQGLLAEASLDGTETTYGNLLEVARPFGKDPDTYNFNNLRADLAWISKYSKAVRGGVHQWPIVIRELDDEPEKGDRLRYRMPRQVAEWWLDIAGG